MAIRSTLALVLALAACGSKDENIYGDPPPPNDAAALAEVTLVPATTPMATLELTIRDSKNAAIAVEGVSTKLEFLQDVPGLEFPTVSLCQVGITMHTADFRPGPTGELRFHRDVRLPDKENCIAPTASEVRGELTVSANQRLQAKVVVDAPLRALLTQVAAYGKAADAPWIKTTTPTLVDDPTLYDADLAALAKLVAVPMPAEPSKACTGGLDGVKDPPTIDYETIEQLAAGTVDPAKPAPFAWIDSEGIALLLRHRAKVPTLAGDLAAQQRALAEVAAGRKVVAVVRARKRRMPVLRREPQSDRPGEYTGGGLAGVVMLIDRPTATPLCWYPVTSESSHDLMSEQHRFRAEWEDRLAGDFRDNTLVTIYAARRGLAPDVFTADAALEKAAFELLMPAPNASGR